MGSKLAIIILTVASLFGQITSAYAQQGNTIFYSTLYNDHTASLRTTLPAYSMIGQVGHQATIVMSAQPAKTCTPSLTVYATVRIDGSYDNLTWVPMSVAVLTNSSGVATVTGQGLFPYVSLSTAVADTTNCQISAWYAGTITNTTNTPATATSSAEAFSTNVNSLAVEKGNRRTIVFGSPASAAVATVTITGSVGTTTVVDCIVASQTASGATTGTAPYLSIVGSATGQLWQIGAGMPISAAGNTWNHSICGLAIPAQRGEDVTVAFSASTTNLVQYLSVTYYKLVN